jgi:hypothetical protein
VVAGPMNDDGAVAISGSAAPVTPAKLVRQFPRPFTQLHRTGVLISCARNELPQSCQDIGDSHPEFSIR